MKPKEAKSGPGRRSRGHGQSTTKLAPAFFSDNQEPMTSTMSLAVRMRSGIAEENRSCSFSALRRGSMMDRNHGGFGHRLLGPGRFGVDQ